jgi:hypothetical protein
MKTLPMAFGVVAVLIIILTVSNMHGTASADAKLRLVDDRRHQAFSGFGYSSSATNSSSAVASANNSSAVASANSISAEAPSANSSSAAPPSANSSSAATNATAEPTYGQSFVWQGTASSHPDPLPGHEKEYLAAILKLRSDNDVYSGVLTYSASRGANVEIWHAFHPGNTTAIPKSFGVMKIATYNNKPIALTDISPSGSAGSVPFSGNAVLLHASSPFTVTYTVNAVAQPTKTVNNIQTAMAQSTSSSSSSTSGGPSMHVTHVTVHHKGHHKGGSGSSSGY